MIAVDQQHKVFTLHTQNTTYQMKADPNRVLLHTYYGARIRGGDLSRLIRYADRGFSPNPSEAGDDRTYPAPGVLHLWRGRLPPALHRVRAGGRKPPGRPALHRL